MIGVIDFLEEIRGDFPLPLVNIGYNPVDLKEGFKVGIVIRATRLLHVEAI